MKKLILNPVIVAMTLFAYLSIGVALPVMASPVQSKIDREAYQNYIEGILVKADVSYKEIQAFRENFNGLSNKDIMALASTIDAYKASGSTGESIMEALGIAVLAVLILLSISASAVGTSS
ncbi:MAG: hypothetical protein KAI43_10180 [Candidatus Aureabacteria bacterium]|nr:hypothetical protein [Candidatus Auribacterota bacterium]